MLEFRAIILLYSKLPEAPCASGNFHCVLFHTLLRKIDCPNVNKTRC